MNATPPRPANFLPLPEGERVGERAVALFVFLTSASAFACSGEGAADAMARASLVGLGCLLISFASTIAAIVRQRRVRQARGVAIAAVVLLLLHPSVWLGVRSGDCGRALMVAGPVSAMLHLGLLGFLLTRKPLDAK